jgi:hypothetical protein
MKDFKKLLEEVKAAKKAKSCPYCKPCDDCDRPWRESQCILNKPLMMVIPPGGVHLDCPVHPEGHHIFGPPSPWMETPTWADFDSTYRPIEYDHDPSKDLMYDSTHPVWNSGDKL